MKEGKGKRLWVCLALLLFSVLLTNTVSVMAAEKIAFTSKYYYLYLGQGKLDTKAIKVKNIPDGATVTYTSADETIATVSEDGVVTAHAPGNVRITCKVQLGEQVSVCRTTVKVRDNIQSITLELKDTTQLKNALRRKKSYELAYSCITDTGNNENSGNYLHYEVYNASGELADYAKVEDGKFSATRNGKYTVKVYVFLNETVYKKWTNDREKYANRLLASDELVLTVTPKTFDTSEEQISEWLVQLPKKYFVSEQDFTEDVLVCSINTQRGNTLAASNIHIRVDALSGDTDFEELKSSMAQTYTKSVLKENWKSVYPAKTVTIKNLKKSTVTLGDKSVYQICYDVVLKNIQFVFENAVDISIDRLEFHNTIYTWYEADQHITVSALDAYEALQPNITDVAKKLVETFRKK